MATLAQTGIDLKMFAVIWMNLLRMSLHTNILGVISKESISIFPNNKPWVSKSVQTSIIQSNISSNQGDDTQGVAEAS